MVDNIYFAASISGGRQHSGNYIHIVNYLKKYGNVLTEHFADKSLTSSGTKGLSKPEIHDQDMSWLKQSKYVVAEVTQASLGVGYELGRMVERNLWVPEFRQRNILALYKPSIDRRLSAMIEGSPGIRTYNYNNLDEAFRAIDDFFQQNP